MLRHLVLLVAVVTLTLGAEECSAQRGASPRVPNYSRRPVISPYVNLFNNNQGGINNYFSIVRPLQQQQQINQQQFDQNRYFQQQIGQPYQQPYGPMFGPMVGGGPGMLRQASPGVGQPAAAATFFNYSHFYNNNPNASGRR